MTSEPRLLLTAAKAYHQNRNFRACVRALGLLRHPALPAELLQGREESRSPLLAQVVYKDDSFTQYIMPAPNVENFPRDDRPHQRGDAAHGGPPEDDDLGGGDYPGGDAPEGDAPAVDAPEGDAYLCK